MKKTFLTITLVSLNIVTCFGAENVEDRWVAKPRVITVTDDSDNALKAFEASIADTRMPLPSRLKPMPARLRSMPKKNTHYTLRMVKKGTTYMLNLEALSLKNLALISPLFTVKKFNALNLRANTIEKISPKTFEKLTHLKSLDLYHNQLAELPDEVFAGLGTLEELVLTENDIQSLGTALHGLDKLQKLYIATNRLQRITRTDLDGLHNLRHLCLNYNPIKDIEEGAFSELTHLELLEFEYTGIAKEEFEHNRAFYGLRPECVVIFE